MYAVTQAVHERLHRHPLLSPLLGTGLTHARYRAALVALFGFQDGAAQALAASTVAGTDGPGPVAERLVLLQADLEALGVPPSASAQKPCAWLPVPESAPAYWGVRYVVDGSALGGRVIARTVATQLGLAADTGLGYFSGLREATGEAWRELCQRLALELASEPARIEAGETAVQTFLRLEAWLDRCLAGGESAAA